MHQSYEILMYTSYLSVQLAAKERLKTNNRTDRSRPIYNQNSRSQGKYCNLLHYKIFTTLLCKQFNVTARIKLTTDVQSFACIPLKISIYIFYLRREEIATFLFRSISCYTCLESLCSEFVCSNGSMQQFYNLKLNSINIKPGLIAKAFQPYLTLNCCLDYKSMGCKLLFLILTIKSFFTINLTNPTPFPSQKTS